jgi:hypothetical protein
LNLLAGHAESCEKIYFVIIGMGRNVSVLPLFVQKKNDYLDSGCKAGSAKCCYYYSLILKQESPKISMSLLIKMLSMKFPPESALREISGLLIVSCDCSF